MAELSTLRAEAQAIYAQVEEAFSDGIKNILSGPVMLISVWLLLSQHSLVFGMTIPPLFEQLGSLTHSPKNKADLLAYVFDSKQIRESVSPPPSYFPDPQLTTIAFWSCVVKFLMDLDTYGGTDLYGFSHYFLRKIHHFYHQKFHLFIES